MKVLRIALVSAALALAGGSAIAQETPLSQPQTVQSSVLIIDRDSLFTETLYGQRVLDEIQTKTDALAAENNRIADALTEEEQSIAARRPTMDPEAFRAEADAFDEKVVGIREAQNAKEAALQQELDASRAVFDSKVNPILGRLMQERGATALLGRRDVILYFGAIDITAPAIAAIDAELGDGTETSGE